MTPALVERGRKLLTRYGLGDYGAYKKGGDAIFYGDQGILEHVIHELSHARLLGIRFGTELSDKIGQALSIAMMAEKKAIHEEAKTWAVEWHCVQALDLGFEWGDIVDGALIQGCSEYQVSDFYDNPESKQVAASVLAHLRRRT